MLKPRDNNNNRYTYLYCAQKLKSRQLIHPQKKMAVAIVLASVGKLVYVAEGRRPAVVAVQQK